jgi:hypothetical protein
LTGIQNALNTRKEFLVFVRVFRGSKPSFFARVFRPVRGKSPGMNTEILFKEESYKIVGACFEVYRENA